MPVGNTNVAKWVDKKPIATQNSSVYKFYGNHIGKVLFSKVANPRIFQILSQGLLKLI